MFPTTDLQTDFHIQITKATQYYPICEIKTKLATLESQSNFTYLQPVVRPTPKFHFAFLIIERKPGDIDFTCAFKYTRRQVETTAVIADYDVGRVSPVKTLVSAGTIFLNL